MRKYLTLITQRSFETAIFYRMTDEYAEYEDLNCAG